MRAGQLRHRVTFQTSTISPNAVGDPVQSWSDIGTVSARVEALAGKERFSAMQQQADADYRIVCRYHSGLSGLAPEDRATWGDRTFDVKAVLNTEGRNRELQVFVTEHIGQSIISEDRYYVVNSGIYVVNSGTQVVNTP